MAKILLLIAAAFAVPVSAMSQAAQLDCTAPGFGGPLQWSTINRTGVGAYTLTAVIRTDVVIHDGEETSGGVTMSSQARDSQGRTRVDQPATCFMDKSGQSHWIGSVQVIDPVAHTWTLWYVNFLSVKTPTLTGPIPTKWLGQPPVELEFRLAHALTKISEQDPEPENHVQTKSEDLGYRMMVGLKARGIRITTTSPGNTINNGQPVIETEERWVSEEYRIILMDTMDSSIFGKSSYEVTRFTLGDPAPSLFEPPAGN